MARPLQDLNAAQLAALEPFAHGDSIDSIDIVDGNAFVTLEDDSRLIVRSDGAMRFDDDSSPRSIDAWREAV